MIQTLNIALVLIVSASSPVDQVITVTTLNGQRTSGQYTPPEKESAISLRTKIRVQTIDLDKILKIEWPNSKPDQDDAATWPVSIRLHDGSWFPAQITGQNQDSMQLRTPLNESLSCRIVDIRAVRWNVHNRENADFTNALLDAERSQDVLITERGGKSRVFSGSVEDVHDDGGTFARNNRTITFTARHAYGVVLAQSRKPATPAATVKLGSDMQLCGDIVSLTSEHIKLQLTSGQTLTIPIHVIRNIRLQSRRLRYVSELSPTDVIQQSSFSTHWPHRNDRNVENNPMMMKGTFYERGIGVHATCELTYDLPAGFETLVAEIGIDDSSRVHCSVVFSVRGDGQVLFTSKALSTLDEPQLIKVDLRGKSKFTLSVRADSGLDLGARANWGELRLIR